MNGAKQQREPMPDRFVIELLVENYRSTTDRALITAAFVAALHANTNPLVAKTVGFLYRDESIPTEGESNPHENTSCR